MQDNLYSFLQLGPYMFILADTDFNIFIILLMNIYHPTGLFPWCDFIDKCFISLFYLFFIYLKGQKKE